LPYSPGILKAVGVKDGKEMESAELKTAGSASKFKLVPDRKKLLADGQDLSFVIVELVDKNGCLQPNAENQLTFKVEGPGVIAGVDNANLQNTESYIGNTRKAWHGRAMVVLKSTHAKGSIKLTVRAPGIPDATTIIKVGN